MRPLHLPSFSPRVTRAMLALALLVAGACYFGPRLTDFPAATQPAGTQVRLMRRGWMLEGELLAVRDSAVLVRQDRHVVLVPWRRVAYLVVPKVATLATGGKPPGAALRERLRLMSRFPQDLTPAVERALLASLGRDSVEVER